MKITQIVYKVDDLPKAICSAAEKGLIAEYGRKKNPYNAFVYFADDTFLEFVDNMGIPTVVKMVMKIVNKKFINRFEKWDNAKEGPLGIGIQITEQQLQEIEAFLKKKYSINCFRLTSKRKDLHGVNFVAQCLFPENSYLPFFVTPYHNAGDTVLHQNLNGKKTVKHLDIAFGEKEYVIVCDLLSEFQLWEDLGASVQKGEYGFEVMISDVTE